MPKRGLYKRGNIWWCCYKDWSGAIKRESTRTLSESEALSFYQNRKNENALVDLEAMKRSCEHTSLRGQLVLAKLQVAILERKIRELDYEPDNTNVDGQQCTNEKTNEGNRG